MAGRATERLRALVVDLDGVLTRTAAVHARAWKAMFDDFLADYAAQTGETQPSFDIRSDYPRHLDGKPRERGIADFLQSRGIELPEGGPDDAPDAWTQVGLGKRKNRLFREAVERDGVEVYWGSVAKVERLRAMGVRTGLVTSSRNGRMILHRSGLADLFDVILDGEDAQRAQLAGKPDPAVYLEAARRLDCAPAQTAVVEDALAGVEAGRRGGFGLVVGIDRADQAAALREHGADLVLADLADLDDARFASAESADALQAFERLADWLGGRRPAIFLDYDGTLTPIVDDPAAAELAPPMRERLRAVARHCLVAVISGRDLADVRQRVDLPGLYYAGSHGFEIVGPGGSSVRLEKGEQYLPALDRAHDELQRRLGDIDGLLLERKRFSLAVHYRRCAPDRVEGIEQAVDEVAEAQGLRRSEGKKLFELQPPVEWDKGHAVRWLMELLEVDPARTPPLYIGDDRTDEDAFRALADDGLGILVGEAPQRSAAAYRLEDPAAVGRFLERLLQIVQQPRPMDGEGET